MTSVARISSGASSAKRSSARPTKPTASPTTVPPAVSSRKRTIASVVDGDPLTIVPRTALNAATPVPSFRRLSPSRIALSPAGAATRRSRVTTAMGSVAARIAPISMPSAHEKPTSRWVSAPMRTTVSATPTVTRSPTGSSRRRNSARSSVSAASNTSPGTNATSRMSAPICGSGVPGRSPTSTPASASTTGYGTSRVLLERRPRTVAMPPTRMSSRRNRCWAVMRGPREIADFEGCSQLDRHAVARGFHLGAEALGEVRRNLPRMRAPDRHPEVRDDREARFGVANDALDVGEAKVRQARPALHEHEMDDHHAGLVLLGDAFVVLRVGHPAEPVAEAETEGLHLVEVRGRGGEVDAVDAVLGLGLQPDDLLREVAQVVEHDRVAVERVARTEQFPAMAETAVCHRLDHHVHVVAVIEVAVADHDGVELGQVDLALRVLHDRARPRVEADARVAFFQVKAPRRRDLLGDHEAGAGGAHERELHVSSPPRGEVGPGPSPPCGEVGPGAKRHNRVGAIKSLQPPTGAPPLSPRSSGRRAARRARACRSPRPACRLECARCGGTEGRSHWHAGPTAVSSQTPLPARPLVLPRTHSPHREPACAGTSRSWSRSPRRSARCTPCRR